MWSEKVLRNCQGMTDDQWGGRVVERVEIEWHECGRLLKKQTRGGEPIRVLLPPGKAFGHNDVVFEDDHRAIVIDVIPCELIVARVEEFQIAAILALELGNLHLPVEVRDREVIFLEDGPVMAILEQRNIPWSREVRRFAPTPITSAPAVKISKDFRTVLRPRE